MEQQGVTIWLTGLSSSGKTTLAQGLESRMKELGMRVERLDGDDIRRDLSNDLGFTRRDREINMRRVGFVAKLLTRNGVAVIAALISPYRQARDLNRSEIGNFVEIYCRCPLEVAERRDVKGLYKRARRGEIKSFTGIDDPYEPPTNPEIIVDTDKETVAESLEKIWTALKLTPYLRI